MQRMQSVSRDCGSTCLENPYFVRGLKDAASRGVELPRVPGLGTDSLAAAAWSVDPGSQGGGGIHASEESSC